MSDDKEPQQWELNLLAQFPRPIAVLMIALVHGINEAAPHVIAYGLLIGIVAFFVFITFRFGIIASVILAALTFTAAGLYDIYIKHNARLPKREKKDKE